FIEANTQHVAAALAQVPAARRDAVHVAFTAHSIPLAMARQSRYEAQLAEAARLVAEGAGVADHAVVYQSRSGSPRVPWLEPGVVRRALGRYGPSHDICFAGCCLPG